MSVSSNDKPQPSAGKIFGKIVGWLFNAIWIVAILLIMMDVTGQRKSFADKKPAPAATVEESAK